jgi:hypothetical protein
VSKLAVVTLVAALTIGVTAAPAPASAKGSSARPDATLPHLGPAPRRCFEYGSSHNICNGASFPYPPNANFLYATYYGTVFVSPHIARIGQDITATAVPDNKGMPSWGGVPGKVVAGCKGHDASCTFKPTAGSAYPPDAKAPGGGYSALSMTFCGFFGCAESQDFYYVLPHKRAISGSILRSTTNSAGHAVVEPVSGAVVKIAGAQNGTAVTGADGFYDALVDPGKYTASVESIGGEAASATPSRCSPGSASGNSCKLDVTGSDGDADFTPCPGAGQASAAAAGGASCPLLDVKVTPPKLKHAGLGPGPAFLDQYKGPCLSGCTNLTLTVTDRSNHNQPVAGANVTASVNAVSGGVPDYPFGHSSGTGYLCDADQPTSCGRGGFIKNLTTDGAGHVSLLYWAPGLIDAAKTTLSVTADEACSASACPAREKSGRLDKEFTVAPQLIAQGAGPLSAVAVRSFADWAAGPTATGFLKDQGKSKFIDLALRTLLKVESAAETASPFVGAVLDVATLTEARRIEYGLMASILDVVKIHDAGLGFGLRQPVADHADISFADRFAQEGGLLSDGGMLYQYGKRLRQIDREGTLAGAERVRAKVYEVSYCKQADSCQPNYDLDGIRPYLHFEFAFDRLTPGTTHFTEIFSDAFTVPYNARVWRAAQLGEP